MHAHYIPFEYAKYFLMRLTIAQQPDAKVDIFLGTQQLYYFMQYVLVIGITDNRNYYRIKRI